MCCGVALTGVFPVWDAQWPLIRIRLNNKGAKYQISRNITFFNGLVVKTLDPRSRGLVFKATG